MSSTSPTAPPSPTAAWLGRLRNTARALLVTQRLGWLIASVVAVLIIAGATDYILRTPVALRIVLWLVGLAVIFTLLRRVVWPAVRFRPSLTEVALRVENSPEGRDAGLTGLLASGLELEHTPAHSALANPVIAEARKRLGTLATARLLAPTRTIRAVVWLIAAIASVAIIASLEPGLTRIGASRVLWPFSGAQWPKRTGVVDITDVRVHPLGSALALRAAVTKTTGDLSSARVAANYRTIVDNQPGPVRRVLLTSQDRDVRIDPGSEQAADGTDVTAGRLFERLLEPSGLGSDTARRAGDNNAAASTAPAEMTLEYWFETDDDQTRPARILLVEPPAIVAASASVELPAYAASMLDRFPELARAAAAAGGAGGEAGGRIDLGPGTDERAAAPAVLAGSRIALTIRLNKPVPSLPAANAAPWLTRSLGPEAAALLAPPADGETATPATFSADGATWTLAWTITDPLRLTVKATDEYGITGVEEANYRFDAVRDNPPTAVITTPTEDRSVLATAIVELAAEGRDDVGLASLTLERQLARRPKGSEGAPAEPTGDRVEFAAVRPDSADVSSTSTTTAQDTRRLTTTHSLDLSEMELIPGDEVWITALAADLYELNGARHEPVRSGIRRLRIMSREELVQQIWSELSNVRRTAVKIDDDQKTVARSTAKPGAEEARRNQRAQSGLTERLARQAQEIDRLEERVDENGLTDPGLNEILDQARDTLAKAGEQSVEASNALNEAEKAQSQENSTPETGAQERAQAEQSQEQVREELGRLIDLLDQGEDTYTAKRELEQILQEQKSLQNRTQQTGRQTTGKSQGQLSPQEKQDLEQIAQEQQQAADKLQEAIEKMLEREQKLEKNDPAAAQQMAQAAQRGQREQTAQKMQQAAQQVQQNQTNTAQQQQQQAIQSLEQMLKELDKTAETRDEVLRRFLASLIESLNGLIAQQEARLAELDAAIPDGNFTGLDAPMARLHQTTLGVLDEASAAPREAAALELIERAADAQAAAVVGLRDDPVNDEEVRAQEQLSLDKLKEALEAAQQIDEAAEERQQDRKRQELRQKYEEALKTQTGIRESTLGLVGAEASRRNKAAARSLGGDQETLRQTVEAIRADIKELREARTFDYAHTRLNDLMTSAAERLSQDLPTDDTTRRQTAAARVLASLVDALDDRKKDDKKFREREQDQQQGGGGGGANQPLVPPAAELKLLRLLQQEAAERTREVGESRAPSPAEVAEVTTLQRDISKQAQDLLDRLTQQGGGGGGGDPPGDEPKPEAESPTDPPIEPPAEPASSPEPKP